MQQRETVRAKRHSSRPPAALHAYTLPLLLLALCGATMIAADGYDFGQPSNNNNLAINDNAAAINMAADAYDDGGGQQAVSTPHGYDYRQRQQQQQQLYVPAVVYDAVPAHYQFDYGVHDESTGDIKSHRETRDGYVVRGSYSVNDPDGYKRTVTYTVDGASGFNAVVSREPIAALLAARIAQAQSAAAEAAIMFAGRQQQQQQQQQLLQSSDALAASSPVEPRNSYSFVQQAGGDGGIYA